MDILQVFEIVEKTGQEDVVGEGIHLEFATARIHHRDSRKLMGLELACEREKKGSKEASSE
jgi:hypothetical protein